MLPAPPAPPVVVTPAEPPTTPILQAATNGYWMLSADGTVYAFGDAHPAGSGDAGAGPAVDLEPTPDGAGYWIAHADGHVSARGDAPALVDAAGTLATGESVTSLSATPTGRGYWLFTDAGRVIPEGDAVWYGDLATQVLNGPVLDSVATPTGRGYYLVASDGGVFAFGDARFAGSMGGRALNAPVRSLVPDGDGTGYWLVASDGGIFAFDAPFLGSMGGTALNAPITGMVASRTGVGYLMVAEDGGIFAFGDVAFRGSLGATPPASPITAVGRAAVTGGPPGPRAVPTTSTTLTAPTKALDPRRHRPVAGQDVVDAADGEVAVLHHRSPVDDRVVGADRPAAQPRLERVRQGAGEGDALQLPRHQVADRAGRQQPQLARPPEARRRAERRHLQRVRGPPWPRDRGAGGRAGARCGSPSTATPGPWTRCRRSRSPPARRPPGTPGWAPGPPR